MLPADQVARHPLAQRDGARLLVVDDTLQDRAVTDLPTLLRRGDVVVVNDVRVRKARIAARRDSGGAVEVLVLRADGDVAEVLVRPARKVRVGEVLRAGPGAIRVLEKFDEGRATVQFSPSLDAVEAAVGSVPLPPYLERAAEADDEARYQTIFARPSALAAAAAPTAGLHLSAELLDRLRGVGALVVAVTLEVGLGTFRPLTPQVLARGRLHPERFSVPGETWAAVSAARAEGRRVVAVGTTAVRVLESASGAGPGETDVFLREGWVPARVDALFTNFHLPRSSLLMLVAAFAGRERVLSAYAHAVAQGYRFFSYGDACFFPRRTTALPFADGEPAAR